MVEHQEFHMVQPNRREHAELLICHYHFLLVVRINWNTFLLLSIKLSPCNIHPMAIILSSGQYWVVEEGTFPRQPFWYGNSWHDAMSLLSEIFLILHLPMITVSWLILILLTLPSEWVPIHWEDLAAFSTVPTNLKENSPPTSTH